MDILTHSISGYLLKKNFYKGDDGKKILIVFIVAALFPDIDIIWSYNNYDLHRVITHSLLLAPVSVVLLSTFFYYIFKKELKFKNILLASFLGVSAHIFLDTIVIWGTPLFWPVSDTYYSLNIYTFVLEPLFAPVYLVFLAYLLKIIKTIPKKLVVIISIFMISVIGLKFGVLTYAGTITKLKNTTTVPLILEISDLSLARYYNSISVNGNLLIGEIIDVINREVIDTYEREVFIDKKGECSNLHKGYLYKQDNLVGDIRYSLALTDSGNCFYGKKIEE